MNLISSLCLAAIPISFIGLVYIGKIWWKEGRSSPYLRGAVVISAIVWVAAAYFLAIAAIRLEGGLEAVPIWTQWVTTVIGLLLASVVAVQAFIFWRARH